MNYGNKCGTSDCGSAGSCNTNSSGCETTDMMLMLANKAWMQLAIDKMKAELEKQRGEKMNRVAAAVVEASIAKWEHKMKGKMQCSQTKDKIQQAFMA